MNNYEDFIAKYAQERLDYESRTEARLQDNKSGILTALRQVPGVEFVEIRYSGYGDSGQIDSVNLLGAAESPLPPESWSSVLATVSQEHSIYAEGHWQRELKTESLQLEHALKEFCADLLEVLHPGYEINEGGQGKLVIGVAEGLFNVHHQDNIVSSYDTETRF